jgi:penicillin G amidase
VASGLTGGPTRPNPRGVRKWLLRIGIGLGALLGLVALGLGLFIYSSARSVPTYRGTVPAPGLGAAVTVLRDRYAVPTIEARSFIEAAYGLGYVHAQDRLWQMEMARRFVQGRLAELFGARAVPADELMRRIGLYGAAEQAVKHLSPDGQRTLAAYAAGVNAYIAGHRGPWPIEFTLAGDTPPERWQPADSIAVLKGMALQLSGNMFAERARAELIPVLGVKGVQEFFPPFDAAPLPEYLDEIYLTTRTGQAYAAPDTTASDNWVVDGAHSITGKPLLANDPHLGFTIPSVWYLAHLSFGDEDIVGGTLPGIPAVIAGRNRHVAWGETNTEPDTEDLYLERLNPDNTREYQVPGGWATFETTTEIVGVRFGAARRILVRATRHGPVVSDGDSSFATAAPQGYALSLAWTALAPNDTTFDGIVAMNRAADVNAIKHMAAMFVTPMQNIVYADDSGDSGHIGLVLPGRAPIRAQANDSLGLVPEPGWDAKYDWQGLTPADMPPTVDDPPSGWIATANNDVVPKDYPYTLARTWEPPYRYDRIRSLLLVMPKQTVAHFEAMQYDAVDTYALALKQRLIAAGPFVGADVEPARLIAAWNGAMLKDRPEPLIYEAWARALARRIYADELGANFARFWGYRPEFTLRVLDNIEGQSRWCDDRGTPQVEDCASRIRLALHDAVTELSQAYGDDPHSWRFGDAHKAINRAQPFGSFPIIGGFFNREVPVSGGPETLLRADNDMASPTPYAAIHGAGYRGIYDLGRPENSRYIISTGESGNLFSSHYDDLLPLWAKGEYIAMPIERNKAEAQAADRLVLQPESSVAVQ